MKKLGKLLSSQMFTVGILLVLQIVLLAGIILRLSEYFVYAYGFFVVISLLVVLHVVNKADDPSYKLAWCIPILVFPIFGGLFYLLTYSQQNRRAFARRLRELNRQAGRHLSQPEQAAQALRQQEPSLERLLHYMNHTAGAAVCQNTTVTYLPLGEDKWREMLALLESAQRYIFLEYFIIKDGRFWNSVLDVLKRKAAQGVDVRLIYDGIGCLPHLPAHYPKQLEEMGIKCRVFNPFRPFLTVLQNNRDHRKICAVDGTAAICGGINLADEYVNITAPLGHWKDTAVLLRGQGAWHLTLLFLETWQLLDREPVRFSAFRPITLPEGCAGETGFVLPFGDTAADNSTVGQHVFLHTVNNARRYVHIMTPYLIPDHDLVTALLDAAKSGVEVRIIVPGTSDHWYAHAVAKAYYAQLEEGGVEIYRYTPGFIHAKSMCWDDQGAVVGTINLDYRSLYLQQECAVWMHSTPAVADVEADFQQTLQRCHRLTEEEWTERSLPRRLLYAVLRVFAPLM